MFAIRKMRPRLRAAPQCGIERLETRCLLQATAAQFTEVNLVSDGSAPAAFTDPNLVNAWGLAASPTGPFWVANNGTGTATLYDGHGQAQPLVVKIPSPAGSSDTAAPTGEVFNGTSGFAVTANGQTGPAAFLFATEQGTISGWNPTVDPTNAVVAVDNSATGAIYKGLATGTINGQQVIYATDFHNGKVDVFDANFNPVTVTGGFTDRRLPVGYAPFGIANINGQIYVSYARQDAAGEDDVPGRGRGFVDVYSNDGVLVRRLIRQGRLNAPWGMAVAPADFGAFSNDLLVGNFGDGTINVYNPTSGRFLGTLRDRNNVPINIDGLWALSFGNGGSAGATNTLFFTAGPDDEQHGLFGLIGANNPTGTTTTRTTTLNPASTTTPTSSTSQTPTTTTTGTTTTSTQSTSPTASSSAPPLISAPTNSPVSAPTNPPATVPLTNSAQPINSTLSQGSNTISVPQTDVLGSSTGSLFG